MRIALLGYCDLDGAQNGIRIAQSWIVRGHNVRTFNFSDPAEQTVDNILKFRPEFCLVTMGRNWEHNLLLKLKENNIFLVQWIADEYAPGDAHGGEWFENIKGIYNLLMCETKGIVPLLKGYADEVIHIPQFFDHMYHKCTEKRLQNFIFDLGFLGGPNIAQSSVRLNFINNLIADGYNIKISGTPVPWVGLVHQGRIVNDVFIQGPLVNGDMAKFYARTKIGLNFVNDKLPKYELALSNRAMKTVGCGCFLLTQEVDGLEDMLIPGKHCETYPGTDYLALKEKIDFFLKNSALREQISLQGQQYVLKNYNIDVITKGFIDEIVKRI